MAFIGNRLPEIQELEEKTELTIALDKIGKSHSDLLFNNVLEVLKKYCDEDINVFVLKDNNQICYIHDYDEDYYVIFSNKFLANKFNKGAHKVEEIPLKEVVVQLMKNINIGGINLDRATSGLLIETPKLLDKIFGIRDIYKLNMKDWGKGIPEYNSHQLMNNEMLLDFGMQVVHGYLTKTGYKILHGSNRLDSNPNIIAIKNDKLSFITVEATVAPTTPIITDNKKSDALEEAFKYHADAYYAPVSFGSTDPIRFENSIALQGDSFYAKFVELERLESQYS